MADIIELKNKKTGVKQYPITKAQAVYNGSDGNTVSQKLETDENDIKSLKLQLDSFTHLAEGSTTGDAELDNARTTWYGVKEERAGNAIRNQAQNLILVQSGKPTGNALKGNKVWIKPSQKDIEIPDMDDMLKTNNDINNTIGALYDKIPYASFINNSITPTVSPYHTYKKYDFIAGKQYGIILRVEKAKKNKLKKYVNLFTAYEQDYQTKVDDITNGYVDQNDEYQAFIFTATANANYITIYLKAEIGQLLNYDLYILDSFEELFNTKMSENILKTVQGSGILVNSAQTLVAPYDDLNSLPQNTTISYSSAAYMPKHTPIGIGSGFTIVSLSRSIDKKYTSASMQILIARQTGGITRSHLFYRISWGGATSATWSEWIKAELSPDNFPAINLSLFEKVGVIGDSFSSGSNDYNQGVTNYAVSWLQIMKRMHGWVEADNYSKGGLTSRTWLTNDVGLKKLNESGWKQLYFIALGINDSNPDSRNVPVGVIDDFTNTTTPPDTFYGNIGQIYRAIKAKNSAAVVCFITIPRFDVEGGTVRYAPYDEAIKAMANATHSMLIDSNLIGLFHMSWWTSNLLTSHPTAPMYSAMAKAYSKAFESAALRNMTYFKTYNGYLNNDPTATDQDDTRE